MTQQTGAQRPHPRGATTRKLQSGGGLRGLERTNTTATKLPKPLTIQPENVKIMGIVLRANLGFSSACAE